MQPQVVALLLVALAALVLVTVLVVSNLQATRATAPRPPTGDGAGSAQAALAARETTSTGSPTSDPAPADAAAPPGDGGATSSSSTASSAPVTATSAPPPSAAVPADAGTGEQDRPVPRQVPSGSARGGGEIRSAGPPGGADASTPSTSSASAADGAPAGSPPGDTAAGTPPTTAVPVGLNAVPGQETAVVRWSVSGPTAELAGFEVLWTGGGRSIQQQVGPTTRLAQVDGLSPSTGYAVAVTPIRRDGQPDAGSARSIAVTTLPGSLGPPGGPTSVSVSAGRASLTITWTADPNDQATTQFYVSWGCCGGFLGGTALDRDTRSYTITGLQSGIPHVVEVQSLGPNLEAEPQTKRSISGTPG